MEKLKKQNDFWLNRNISILILSLFAGLSFLFSCSDEPKDDWKSSFGKPVSISLEANATIKVAGGGRTLRLYPCVTTDQGKLYPYELNEVVFFCNDIQLEDNTFSPDNPGSYDFTAKFKSITTSEPLTIHARMDKTFEVIEIPLIFHIYQRSIEPNRISAEEISAITNNLTNIFRRTQETIGYNDQPSGIDTYIQFRLAKYDTLNQLIDEPGMLIHNDVDPDLARQFQYNLDMSKYLNIHVFYDIKNAFAIGPYSLGSNTFPGIKQINDGTKVFYDLSEVDADYFRHGVGITRNISFQDNGAYLLAHEVGHVLGLHHVFYYDDEDHVINDYCEDTYTYRYPNGKSNRYCGWDVNSPIAPLKGHSNIMDYEGPGTNMEFTYDQRERMRWVLDNSPWLNELKYSQQ